MRELLEAIRELERELAVRATVYPRLVFQGKLTQTEADRRARALRHAIYLLEEHTKPARAAQPTITG